MVPICFYVSVYLMDAENQMMEKSNNSNYSSTTDECCRQDDAARLIDTILFEDVVIVNPTSSTSTHAEIEDTKDTDSTVADQTFAKNDTDGNFPSTRVFPGVPLDSESSKENHSEISFPQTRQEIDVDFSSTRVFPSVPFDSESSKKNPIKTSAATETNTSYNDEKDIQATKTNPEVAFDNMSKKDEGEVDTVEDKIIIQDTFIFCPMGGALF